MSEIEFDTEIQALQAIVEALLPLDGATRERVVRYVRARIDDPESWPEVSE